MVLLKLEELVAGYYWAKTIRRDEYDWIIKCEGRAPFLRMSGWNVLLKESTKDLHFSMFEDRFYSIMLPVPESIPLTIEQEDNEETLDK